jgi:hypothetical protein
VKTIQDVLPAFKILTKNRNGPFKIALRSSRVGYLPSFSVYGWSFNKEKAYDYTRYREVWDLVSTLNRKGANRSHISDIMTFVILNAGPDIELKDSDWK